MLSCSYWRQIVKEAYCLNGATKFWCGPQPPLPSVCHLVEPQRETRLLDCFSVSMSALGSSTQPVSPYTHAKNFLGLSDFLLLVLQGSENSLVSLCWLVLYYSLENCSKFPSIVTTPVYQWMRTKTRSGSSCFSCPRKGISRKPFFFKFESKFYLPCVFCVLNELWPAQNAPPPSVTPTKLGPPICNWQI